MNERINHWIHEEVIGNVYNFYLIENFFVAKRNSTMDFNNGITSMNVIYKCY